MGLIAPPCWACQHFCAADISSRSLGGAERSTAHLCDLGLSGFPRVGPRCPSYCYEPGADAAEAGR